MSSLRLRNPRVLLLRVRPRVGSSVSAVGTPTLRDSISVSIDSRAGPGRVRGWRLAVIMRW